MNIKHSDVPRTLGRLALGLALAAAVSGASAGLVGDTTPKLEAPAIVEELKKGGYVIYFRHGTTEKKGEKSVSEKDMGDCEIQRNLSAEGVEQVQAIGRSLAGQGIPMGGVYSSPYCRTMDTAVGIFGRAERSDALFFAMHVPKDRRGPVTQQLIDMLGTEPAPGTNTGLVSHTANLREAVDIWPKPEGVAHVFQPLGNGEFSYVGMIKPDQWPQ